MPVSEDIRAQILERSSAGRLRRIAVDEGMESLRGDGWRLVREGRTTIEEVVRATKGDDIGLAKIEREKTVPVRASAVSASEL